jgi:hypothetical protein
MTAESVSMRPFVWVWLAYTTIVLALALGVWIPSGLYKEMDFRMMYTGGILARTDPAHLYDLSKQRQVQKTRVKDDGLLLPFPHLADESLVQVPFSFLDYRGAYVAMVLFNAVLILVCFLAAKQEFSAIIPVWQPRAGLIFFTFMPVTIVLAEGQDSLMLLLILCLTWKFVDRSNYFIAGLILAFMLFKPHLTILVALLLAVRFGGRFLAGFATGSGIVAAICLPFWLRGGWSEWCALLWQTSLAGGSAQSQQLAVGVYPVSEPTLHGLLYLILGRAVSAEKFFLIVVLASLSLLIWALVRVRRLTQVEAFAFSIYAAAFLGYHFEEADLTILLLPMVLVPFAESKALSACRHAILALPIALLIFGPKTPPGAGFAVVCIPLAASFFLLGMEDHARHSRATIEAA